MKIHDFYRVDEEKKGYIKSFKVKVGKNGSGKTKSLIEEFEKETNSKTATIYYCPFDSGIVHEESNQKVRIHHFTGGMSKGDNSHSNVTSWENLMMINYLITRDEDSEVYNKYKNKKVRIIPNVIPANQYINTGVEFETLGLIEQSLLSSKSKNYFERVLRLGLGKKHLSVSGRKQNQEIFERELIKETVHYKAVLEISQDKTYKLKDLKEKRVLEFALNYMIRKNGQHNLLPFFIEFINDNDENIKWSTGESLRFYSFGSLIFWLNEFYKDSFNAVRIILDEIDTSMHPEWQRLLIHDLIEILNDTINGQGDKGMNLHLFLSTHSPLILSDIKKEDVVYYEDTKVVDVDNKKTFATNIHEILLNDKYLGTTGTIGEFALKKISIVTELLNKDELNNNDIQYIKSVKKIIDERWIKNLIEKKLDKISIKN